MLSASWDGIAVVAIFVLPGFIAIKIRDGLLSPEGSRSEALLESLFYSVVILAAGWLLHLFTGWPTPTTNPVRYLIAALALAAVFGVASAQAVKDRLLLELARLLRLSYVVTPPSIFALLFAPLYARAQTDLPAQPGKWVRFRADGAWFEGWLAFISYNNREKALLVAEVLRLRDDFSAEDGPVIAQMWVNLERVEALQVIP